MGLLDSVLGAVMGGGQQQANAAGGGGLASIIGMVASNPQLLQAVTGMLGSDGQHGGLGGLVSKFEQAGMGDVVKSWIGNGQNQAISGDQLTQVLGSGAIGDVAAKLGMSQDDAAGHLSQMLPEIINHLTPGGQAPSGGLGNAGDLMGMLGGLLQKS